ncbi:MAG TPA: HAD family hydrolase [Dehalococcoidia bacterium]|nr:HAD family hydrolase [Dehalococcoidia bacterium]
MIFLDIDDTLVTHTGALDSAAIEFGIRFKDRLPHYQDFLSAWSQSFQRHMQPFREGKISLEEQRRRRMREIFQSDLTDGSADELFSHYLELYENNCKLFDDVLPFLDSHPGEKFGIIANWRTKPQVRKLEKTGILKYFSSIVTEEMAGAPKPGKRIFEYALRVSGCSPEDAVYIGDNLQNDAKASGEAGFRGVWLNRNNLKCEENIESIPRLTEFRLLPNRGGYSNIG